VKIKISVITPSLNQGQFIEDNIRSILDQNYKNYEHIIIDGGSIDSTLKVLKKYPHLNWTSEKDNGQSHALNKGFKKAKGDIIFWLNSDDMLNKNAFKIITNYFKYHPDRYIVTGNFIQVDKNGNHLNHKKSKLISSEKLLNRGACVQQISTIFRREVFDTTGYINEEFNYAMDHEYFVRVLKKYKHYIINDNLAYFRKYAETKTSSSELNFTKEIFKLKRLHKGKIFIYDNFRLLLMFIKEPFKKIHWLRRFVRRIRGANPDYIHY